MNDNESIVSLLQEVQAKNGYIPKDEIYRIAAEKGVSPAKVTGVATFYSQFRLSKPGKNLILLCKGTACHVNSADGIAAALKEELGIGGRLPRLLLAFAGDDDQRRRLRLAHAREGEADRARNQGRERRERSLRCLR